MQHPEGLLYRKKLLDKSIREVPNKLEIVRGAICHGMAEVMDIFEARMREQAEGIILKDLGSLYHPSNRSNTYWIKLKAEYIDNLGDTLDLIILGGYFGESSRTVCNVASISSHITSFLVGVLSRVD